MSGGTRFPLEIARQAALEFVEHIADACEKVEIAGSIRRHAEMVGDMEIVCVPRQMPSTQMDLTGVRLGGKDALMERMHVLGRKGLIDTNRSSGAVKAAPFGPRYYHTTYPMHVDGKLMEFPVDLFAVLPPASWGTTLLIRTGCAVFSKWIVQCRRGAGFVFKDGHLEHVSRGTIPTPEERDVFEALDIPYIPPEKRTVDMYGNRLWEEYLRNARTERIGSETKNEGD